MSEKMNKDGHSVCPVGEEFFEFFSPSYHPSQKFVQYDYRDADGELFSCVKRTLQECRESRDKWLNSKNQSR